MSAPDGKNPTERLGARRTCRLCWGQFAALLLALLVFCGLFGVAAPAGASATSGKPNAKAPTGTITTTMPTFAWSKASAAAKYELRVHEGSTLLLKKTGITKLSWKGSTALPKNVSLTWKVRASSAGRTGAWSESLTFTVVPPSSEKAITAFSFQELTPPVIGIINQTLHTIALTVPAGTNGTRLKATFNNIPSSRVTVSGTPQVSGETANDFTNPVTYVVTAGDGTAQTYVVTVTVASGPTPAPSPTPTPAPSPTPTATPTPSAVKAIEAFSFQELAPPVIGTIDQAAHTIALTVPFGTNVTGLVPTITTTGASVSPASGVARDFTSSVTYTVTAADASTQAYNVTVASAKPPGPLAIGDPYEGGIVAYILQAGDPGYVAGEAHGLIAARGDQSTGMIWSNVQTSLVGTQTAIGAGQANTTAIVGQAGCTSGAAYLCHDLVEGGYSDWYLPSRDELDQMYLSKDAIGGFEPFNYWSSSEYDASWVCSQGFATGSPLNYIICKKTAMDKVRAVRAF